MSSFLQAAALVSQPMMSMPMMRGYPGGMQQVPQQFSIPYGTYMPCYPAAQYPNAQGQNMGAMTASGYMTTTVPFTYNQPFPMAPVSCLTLLVHLAILFNGPPKPQACWSDRS